MLFWDKHSLQPGIYTGYLKGRSDHAPSRQDFLQRRVVNTFNRFLYMFTEYKIGHTILDLGGVGSDFCRISMELGCYRAESIGIEQGIDFEMDKFPYPDSSFNDVFATSLIEHLHDPSTMLSETHRVLRPGGRIIIVTPHWPYCANDFYDAYTHVQPYTHKSLRVALECHGFETLAFVPWMVEKSDLFWKIPEPWSFRLASCLPSDGLDERKWIPSFLKGRSSSLLALARKPK